MTLCPISIFAFLDDMKLAVEWTWKSIMDPTLRNSSGTVRLNADASIIMTDAPADLDEALSQDCETLSHIDDVLRSYLTLIANSKGQSR